MDIHCVAKEESLLGEAPLWSFEDQLLYWIDIFKNTIFAYDPLSKKNQSYTFSGSPPFLTDSPTSLNLKKNGGLLITFKKKVVGFDFSTKKISLFTELESDLENTRCNDANCDAKGRLWVGTMNADNPKVPSGSLYRINPDGDISCMANGIACSNGLGWSPDNKTMYFTETFKYTIYAYDFDLEKGEIANQRIFASTNENSYFDGLSVDEKGNVWVAVTKAGKILCFSPSGKIAQEIDFPVPCPTSCCFGGKDFSTLYVTSSRELLSEEELKKYPLSGSLFAIDLNSRGLPSHPFVGDV